MTLSRGACYGTCPVYEVHVRDDGTVTWEGGMFVEVTGNASWRVDSTRIQEIERALEDVGFPDLDEGYPMMTDAPSCTVAVSYADASVKSVRFSPGLSFSRALDSLTGVIERLIGTEPYVGKRLSRAP